MKLEIGRFGLRASLRPFSFEFRSSFAEPDKWLIEYAGGMPTASGQLVTERTAVQISAVFSAVTLISDAIGVAKLKLWEKVDPVAPSTVGGRREAVDHPLYPLLAKQPNEEMTPMTFWGVLAGHFSLWGNAYAEIERDGAGRPVALWPLRPDRTFPRRQYSKGKGPGELIYVVRVMSQGSQTDGKEVILPAENVLHAMNYSHDGLRGLSTIALHRESLGLSLATQDYGARLFGNDARPGGVLQVPHKLKPEAAARLKTSWEEAHRGGGQSHRTAVLEEGVTWQTVGMPNEDAQFLQTRNFQLAEVARMYHVPLHLLAELSHATFSNIEQQSIEFIRHGCRPMAVRFEEEISRKLLTPAEQLRYEPDHDFDDQMRGDLLTQLQADQISWMNGWRSADDVAAKHRWNPLPAGLGARYFIPVNQQPLDTAGAPAGKQSGNGKPAQVPPPAPGDPDDKKKPDQNDPTATPVQQNSLREKLIEAYAPAFLLTYQRLERKERVALERAKTTAARDQFFTEHRQYVALAFVQPLECLARSVATIEASTLDVSGLARDYAEALAMRHCTGGVCYTDAIGKNEARRAVEFFISKVPAKAVA